MLLDGLVFFLIELFYCGEDREVNCGILNNNFLRFMWFSYQPRIPVLFLYYYLFSIYNLDSGDNLENGFRIIPISKVSLVCCYFPSKKIICLEITS